MIADKKLLSGNLTWMAAYVDLVDGLLRPVLAEPRAVAEVAPGVPLVRPAPRRAA